jgi:4-amino-4-deoxy-L-arabinose transferase-like glycosyltransferase
MTTTENHRSRATTLLLAAICALFAMALAYLATRGPVKVDSGIFASGGWHVVNAKTLYSEVWDSKPPGIFLLNPLALAICGREIESVRTLEMLFGVIAELCVFRIALVALGSRFVAAASALLFAVSFYSGKVFEGGNLTEEYASVFALVGVLGAVECVHRAGFRKRLACLLAATGFSLAALTKEPFVLTALPWFAYALITPPAPSDDNTRWRIAILWSAFGSFPLIFLIGLLAANGGVEAWWDSITYHLPTTAWVADTPRPEATGAASTSLFDRLTSNWQPAWNNVLFRIPLTTLAAVLGLFALTSRDFLRRTRYFPLVVLAMFCLDYLGTLISPRHYGHYYMQLVGSFVLLAACGLAFATQKLEGLRAKLPGSSKRVGLAVAVVALAVVAFGVVREDLSGRLQAKLENARDDSESAITAAILAAAEYDDALWATSGNNSRYYLETGLLSPTRFLFVYDHVFVDTWLDSGAQKLEQLRADLADTPPRFVIVAEGDTSFLERHGLIDWIHEHYQRTDVVDDDLNTRGHLARLYVRRDGNQ